MELTTKSASLILLGSGVARCACTRIPCSVGFVCIVACSIVFQHSGILAFLGKFSEYLVSLVFHNIIYCKDSVYNSFLSPLPLSTDLYNMQWGLMAGLPGFASHGRDSLQGAGAHGGSSWISQAPNFHFAKNCQL